MTTPIIVTTEERLRELIREELGGTSRQSSDVMTSDDAAIFLKCSEGYVRKLANAGKLPAHRLSPRDWRFLRSELVAWLAGNPDWEDE